MFNNIKKINSKLKFLLLLPVFNQYSMNMSNMSYNTVKFLEEYPEEYAEEDEENKEEKQEIKRKKNKLEKDIVELKNKIIYLEKIIKIQKKKEKITNQKMTEEEEKEYRKNLEDIINCLEKIIEVQKKNTIEILKSNFDFAKEIIEEKNKIKQYKKEGITNIEIILPKNKEMINGNQEKIEKKTAKNKLQIEQVFSIEINKKTTEIAKDKIELEFSAEISAEISAILKEEEQEQEKSLTVHVEFNEMLKGLKEEEKYLTVHVDYLTIKLPKNKNKKIMLKLAEEINKEITANIIRKEQYIKDLMEFNQNNNKEDKPKKK